MGPSQNNCVIDKWQASIRQDHCVRDCISPLSTITTASIEHPHLIADGVVVLHFAAEHDAARLETPVRMVREACRSLPGRHAQFIQHEEGVEVA